MTANELREAAIDQTKIGGDPARAIALALVYVGDAVREHDTDGIVDALRQMSADIGSLS